jgi:hypothetical protein
MPAKEDTQREILNDAGAGQCRRPAGTLKGLMGQTGYKQTTERSCTTVGNKHRNLISILYFLFY